MNKKNNYLTIGIAIVLLVVAVVVLVDLLGYLSSYNFLGQYWPVLLIFFGILAISGSSQKESGFAFGMIILGLLMLLNTMGVFQTSAGKTILVVLLGLSGIVVLALAASKPPKEPTNKDR